MKKSLYQTSYMDANNQSPIYFNNNYLWVTFLTLYYICRCSWRYVRMDECRSIKLNHREYCFVKKRHKTVHFIGMHCKWRTVLQHKIPLQFKILRKKNLSVLYDNFEVKQKFFWSNKIIFLNLQLNLWIFQHSFSAH